MLDKAVVEEYAQRERSGDHPLMRSFSGLGYVVYKRTYARPVEGENRTEEWHETVERVVNGAQAIGAGLTPDEEVRLFDHIWNMRAAPAGRMLWQLGTDNVQRLGGDSLNNCWHVTLRSPEDFAFLFNELMLGGGVGFTVTEESVAELPQVRFAEVKREDGFDVDYVVPDNREGWAELVRRVLEASFEGRPFTYSTDAIRPAGARISTFGGVASGPGILNDGIRTIQQIMQARDGQKLRPVDVLDIANIIGSIVVSGNVRRSAQIAIGTPNSEFLDAKRWDKHPIPSWRAMSNNSVVVDDPRQLPPEFWEGYEGNGEPYGMINLEGLRRWGRVGEQNYDHSITGVNPCAEIGLADYEPCNLAEIFLPNCETEHQFRDAALLLYKVQKAVAALPYLDPRSNEIVKRNMRLGLSVSGIAQASELKLGWLSPTYERLRVFDIQWSLEKGYSDSIRLTTVKPSGTLSLLAGVTPGVHPGFSQYHVRRVRMAANDPIVKWCEARGYPVENARRFDGSEDSATVVVEFPCEFPPGTVLADELSAIGQLDLVRRIQREWADNAVSVTVYYSKEELPEIKDYLAEHWDEFKTVSFLLREDHGFEQAPLERIDLKEYNERRAAIALSNATTASGVSSLVIDDSECTTGACPIR